MAVASVTWRPVMALRECLPPPPLPPLDSVTVPRGLRAAVDLVTNLPVLALRALDLAMRMTSNGSFPLAEGLGSGTAKYTSALAPRPAKVVRACVCALAVRFHSSHKGHTST